MLPETRVLKPELSAVETADQKGITLVRRASRRADLFDLGGSYQFHKTFWRSEGANNMQDSPKWLHRSCAKPSAVNPTGRCHECDSCW